MYNNSLKNSIVFISICVTLQIIVFVFLMNSSAVASLKLEQVVILSRHNIRTPVSKTLARLTPQSWPHWKENPGILTEKGYKLEGYMGKYFFSWLNKEQLLSDNCPSEEDFYVYSNTMERTLSSARAFVTACFPNCNTTIHHSEVGKPDIVFTPLIRNSTDVFKDIVINEMKYVFNSLNLNESYNVMEDILKYNESDICTMDNDCYLAASRTSFNIVAGMKPNVTGPIRICNQIIDAFVMAYYNGFPIENVAWGKLNDTSYWSSIVNISASYYDVAYRTKTIAKDIAKPLLKYLTKIFLYKNTKVTLLMGHDVNIHVLLSAMSFRHYVLNDSFIPAPVGGKIVFQKWFDEHTNEYLLKVEHVYLSNEQLRQGFILSRDNPPKVKLLELENCKTDNRGFCRWDEFINLLNQL